MVWGVDLAHMVWAGGGIKKARWVNLGQEISTFQAIMSCSGGVKVGRLRDWGR